MKRTALWLTIVAVLLGGTVLAYGVTRTETARSETVVCPLTGETVSKDQCPLIDAGRPDCPGRIECPLTGELVCKDECPLQKAAAKLDLPPGGPCCEQTAAPKSCCQQMPSRAKACCAEAK